MSRKNESIDGKVVGAEVSIRSKTNYVNRPSRLNPSPTGMGYVWDLRDYSRVSQDYLR